MPLARPPRSLALPGLLLVALAFVVAPPAAAQFQLVRSSVVSGVTDASGGAFSVRGVVGAPVVGEISGGEFTVCQGAFCATGTAEAVRLALTVLLAGAYDATAGAMRTALAAGGHVPLAQPYGGAAYAGSAMAYGGAEALGAVPATAVDWVVLELRTSPAAADSVTSVAALVLADGTVVGVGGAGALAVPGLGAGSYHVVVRHRNHLPAMTASALALAAGTTAVDLTAPGAAYGTGSLVEVAAGVWGLWPGDGSLDGLVSAPDFNVFASASAAAASGYAGPDYTLDGLVTAPDFNVFSSVAAAGAASAVPEN